MYILSGFAELPDKSPPADAASNPVRATIGIPGFNLDVPILSKERAYFAVGFSILVGIAGGTVLAQYLKKAQR